MKTFRLALLLALACLLSTISLSGQTTTARLVGIVTDQSGAAVPNAQISITNDNTGVTRTVTSSNDGTYIAVSLQPGIYSVKANAKGFAGAAAKNLSLAVGQEVTRDFQLPIAGTEISVTVDAGGVDAIDTSSARIGGVIPSRELEELPINGRQVSQLYLLVPGATNAGSGNFDNIRFSGRAVEQNIMRLDGVESTSIIDTSPGNLNGELTSLFRLQQSMESIQEFRVDSSSYPAEMGTGTGGQISFITKSGGNNWHGSMFEYLRNDFFDARNYFNRRGTLNNTPKFRLNQFGGSFGGPIVKDKMFVFADYEGLRQVWAVPYTGATLSNYAKSTVSPNSPIYPLLAAFPKDPTPLVQNGSLSTAGVTQVGLNNINEDFGSIRFDYHFSPRFSMYARYNRDQGVSNQVQDLSLSKFGQVEVPQNAVVAFNQVWSSRLFNETKVGFNGIKMRVLGINGPSPSADLSKSRISVAGLTNVGSLISLSSSFNGVGAPYTGQSISYIDNLSYVIGKHNTKFGVEIRPLFLYNNQIGGTTYTYNSADEFLKNTPSQIQFFGDLSDKSPFTGLSGNAKVKQSYYIAYAQDEWKLSPSFTLSYGLRYEYYAPLRETRNKNVFFDMTTGTIKPGYTGDWYTSAQNFAPRLGLVYAPAFLGSKTVLRAGFGLYYGPGQTEDQIQPEANDRVSKTFTSGKVYPINPVADVYTGYDINSPTLGYQPRAYTPTYKVPERVATYTMSVQQQLPAHFQLMVGYVGSQGRNLFLRSITNLITGATTNPTNGSGTAVRQYGARFAEIDYKTSGGTDFYNALQSTLQRHFSRGLSMGLQYTWAKELGTSSGSNEATTAQVPFAIGGSRPEYGRGTFDIRHSMNLTALYELPFGHGKHYSLSGVTDAVAGGWSVGSVVNLRSGLPIDVLITRPDLSYVGNAGTPYAGKVYSSPVVINGAVQTTAVVNVPGGGNSRNIRRPDVLPGVSPYAKNGLQWLNPAAFTTPAAGSFGNARRNNYTGPNLAQLDMTLAKTFSFTERVKLDFRAEAFNILNIANFANPGTVRLAQSIPGGATQAGAYTPASNTLQPGQAFSLTSASNGSFGSLTSTVANQVGIGANRQMQLSLKASF